MVRIHANSNISAISTQTRDSENQNLSARTTYRRENIINMTKSQQYNITCEISDMRRYRKQPVARDKSSSKRTRIIHTKSQDNKQEIEIEIESESENKR